MNLSANQWKDEMTRFDWTSQTGTGHTPSLMLASVNMRSDEELKRPIFSYCKLTNMFQPYLNIMFKHTWSLHVFMGCDDVVANQPWRRDAPSAGCYMLLLFFQIRSLLCWRRSRTRPRGRWLWGQWRFEPSSSESTSDSQSFTLALNKRRSDNISQSNESCCGVLLGFDWTKRGLERSERFSLLRHTHSICWSCLLILPLYKLVPTHTDCLTCAICATFLFLPMCVYTSNDFILISE